MRKRKGVIIVLAAALALAALVFQLTRPVLPSYNGKSLRVWLKECSSADDETNQIPQGEIYEADYAIQQIGTNALPYLLSLVASHDSAAKVKLIKLLHKVPLIKVTIPAEADDQRIGYFGFGALGAIAKPAVNRLINLLQDDDQGVRSAAARSLAAIGPGAKEAVPALIQHLKDSDLNVIVGAIDALGRIHQHPEIAVPALIANLPNTSTGVRNKIIVLLSINALDFFESDAESALPYIRSFTNDSDPDVQAMATRVINDVTHPGWPH